LRKFLSGASRPDKKKERECTALFRKFPDRGGKGRVRTKRTEQEKLGQGNSLGVCG